MKKVFPFFVTASVFIFILSSCASIEVLTPGVIESKIDGGLVKLPRCQFYLNKDVTLTSLEENEPTAGFDEKGTVVLVGGKKKDIIIIRRSTKCALRDKDKKGNSLKYYSEETDSNGEKMIKLYIFFQPDKENDYIPFTAAYNDDRHRFELYGDEINYGGKRYTVEYVGNDRPYLRFKYIERINDKSSTKTLPGLKVEN
jgi:hypothetical protein